MSSISPDGLELVEGLSRISGSRYELHLDNAQKISLTSNDLLTSDEVALCNLVRDLLQRQRFGIRRRTVEGGTESGECKQ